jgi:hypothetical protein
LTSVSLLDCSSSCCGVMPSAACSLAVKASLVGARMVQAVSGCRALPTPAACSKGGDDIGDAADAPVAAAAAAAGCWG